MMSFAEFLIMDAQQLDEGLLRTAALVSWSSKSKSDGDKAVSSFQAGKRILAAGTATDTAAEIQKRTQSALTMLFDGLIDMRAQMGSVAALSLTGHLLSAQNAQTLLKKK
jgi:hypothetical protein